ncbi:cation:proton antiporter [soil metagenome]
MTVEVVVSAAGEAPPAYLGPVAALVVTAAVIGFVMTQVRVVPIVGFLVAGVLIGPAQAGIVDNGEAVQSAAEIGVILLLFTIGIEFSADRLAKVWTWIAFGGALQVSLAIGVGLGLTVSIGGSWQNGVFTGCLLALSSTAIVLKLLADRGEQQSRRGRLALAILIAQDLAVVAMVLVVPMLATGADASGSSGGSLLQAGLTAVAVVAVVLVVARRVMPPVLDLVARTCSPEVFLLTIVATCFGTAYLTALFGISVSLGAFLAGLVVSESRTSSQAFAEVLPLQIIFSAIFFVSVGMLLDLAFVFDNLLLVVGASVFVLVVKTLTTSVAAAALRLSWRTALATGLLLAQVGEFSFVLLTVGTAAGLSPLGLSEGGSQTVVAVTVVLMVSTPLLAALGARIERGASVSPGRAGSADEASAEDDLPDDTDHVVLLGWGPSALELAATLTQREIPVLTVTLNPGGAAESAAAGHPVLRGDPTKTQVLRQAGVAQARLVVVSEDGPERAGHVVSAARAVTRAPIVVRPLGSADVVELAEAGADHVVDHDRASSRALIESVLHRLDRGATGGPGSPTVVDASRVLRYSWPANGRCGHGAMSRAVLPRATGCVDCLREGGKWLHLRTCLSCGYVGCCDSSPRRHARAHANVDSHPLMASAEPGETWAYCFVDHVLVEAPAEVPHERSLPPR